MREVRTLLSSLGGPKLPAAAEALRARGVAGFEALLRALAKGPALGGAGADGRAVFEDLERCLIDIARAEPPVVRRAADDAPALLASFAFVSALTCVEGPEAATHLLRVLDGKSGALRWLALEALVARKDPGAIARLGKATTDRDGTVVLTAVTALRRWGGPSDLPHLEAVARRSKTPPGTREAAYDAIEAICVRAARPLPEWAPPARFVEVALPPGAQVKVVRADRVAAGGEIARVGAVAVGAPCDGVVVAIESEPPTLVLRRSPPA